MVNLIVNMTYTPPELSFITEQWIRRQESGKCECGQLVNDAESCWNCDTN